MADWHSKNQIDRRMQVSGDNEFVLPDASNERCKEIEWLKPHFMDDQGYLIFVIQAFVVDTGERRIVVDTCVGNDKDTGVPPWDNLQTEFLGDLEAAGYPADSIDTVVCTHLHVDHVAGTPCWWAMSGYPHSGMHVTLPPARSGSIGRPTEMTGI